MSRRDPLAPTERRSLLDPSVRAREPAEQALDAGEAGALTGLDLESKTPTGAEIGASLDAVTIVSSRAVTQHQAPNPFDLNAIASKNTPSKRAVFKVLQRTWLDLRKVERQIARAPGRSRPLEARRAALVRQRDEQAAALKTWLRSHALDHSRSRDRLLEDIGNHQNGLRKLKGPAREAAEAALADKKSELAALEASLRSAAEDYLPLRDVQQTHYEIRVPSRSGEAIVRLHDHVIAFAADTPAGFEGGADADTPEAVAAALAGSGVSADKRAMLRILSSLEGRFSTVNTWDRAVITFGFTQWTTQESGDGTLCKLMDSIRTAAPAAYRRCFQLYGLDVAGTLFQVTRPDGSTLAGTSAARHVQTSVKHVAALSAAGMDPDIRSAQIRFAVEGKIDRMLARTLSSGGVAVRLGQVLTSEYGVAVMMDRAIGTGEGGTWRAAQRGFASFVADQPAADLSQAGHRDAAGARVLAAIEALDRKRALAYAALNRQAGSFSA